MKRNQRQPAARVQTLHRLWQHSLYFFKLTVDEDANGLERPGRRVLSALASKDVFRHELRQLAGCIDGCRFALRHDGAGDLATKPLFTIIFNHLVYLLLIRHSQPFSGRLTAGGVHAHIQRRIEAEAESARALINLWRGNTQIKQRTIYLFNAQFIQGRLKRGKAVVHHAHPLILCRQFIGHGNRLRIFIKHHQTAFAAQLRQNQL